MGSPLWQAIIVWQQSFDKQVHTQHTELSKQDKTATKRKQLGKGVCHNTTKTTPEQGLSI